MMNSIEKELVEKLRELGPGKPISLSEEAGQLLIDTIMEMKEKGEC
jgi:hypothetical protein